MNHLNELEERIERIEKELKQIDRLDVATYELEQKLNKATELLIRVVEMNEQIDKNDIDYLLLKLHVAPIKYHELPLLMSRTGRTYRETGEFPDFHEFHNLVVDTLSLTEADKQNFSIAVTENLLKKFMEIEELILSVCEKILSTK